MRVNGGIKFCPLLSFCACPLPFLNLFARGVGAIPTGGSRCVEPGVEGDGGNRKNG